MGYLGFVLLTGNVPRAMTEVAHLLDHPGVMRGVDGVSAQQERTAQQLTLRWPDWSLRVIYTDAPYVLLLQQLSDRFGNIETTAGCFCFRNGIRQLFVAALKVNR